MRIFLMVIIGLLGGVIGGMGMGGGTLLIPMLALFTGIEQHVAQAINLIAFVPMSIVALVIHIKNKLVDYKYLFWLSLPAAVISVPATILAKNVGGDKLGMYFGIFLMILGVYQLICIIVKSVKGKRAKINK